MTDPGIQALVLIISVSFTALTFLGRSAIRQYLERSLEAHKASLSRASEQEIEKLKSELGRVAREHDIVFQRLHGERAETIKSLFEKVRTLSKSAKRYATREGAVNAEDHEANRQSVEVGATALNQAILDARIFLPEDLCARIQQRMYDVAGYTRNVAGESFPLGTPEERFASMLKNNDNLLDAAAQMEADLADEFRRLLGVK